MTDTFLLARTLADGRKLVRDCPALADARIVSSYSGGRSALGCRIVRLYLAPDVESTTHGRQTMLSLVGTMRHAPDADPLPRRIVSATRDGMRWVWVDPHTGTVATPYAFA